MNELKKVKITVLRKANYLDLQKKYENVIEHACMYHEGDVFISIDGKAPEGFCAEAWKSLAPFVKDLSEGRGNFFDGWMQNPYSACISCNDGFRPVSFLVEVIE